MSQSATLRQPIHGWLNLDKPVGLSSSAAVGAVKRLLRPQKIGHAGTLDPLAEGVLPLAMGEATKTVPYLMDARKIYQFTLTFGEKRSTADAEGEVTATSAKRPQLSDILAILPRFRGKILQTPPAFSAIKVDGQRAYALARAGQEVSLAPRLIEIDAIECLSLEDNKAEFRVTCSKGTYIRSLAEDIAEALETLGYVSRLQRLGVGQFSRNNAISLDLLKELVHNAPADEAFAASAWVLPVATVLDDIPAIRIDALQGASVRHGQPLLLSVNEQVDEILAMLEDIPVALLAKKAGQWWPRRVFNL